MRRLIFLGDSITAAEGDPEGGWVGRLAVRVGGPGRLPLDVVNLGVSGATTTDLLRELPAILAAHARPGDICVVAIGINDLHPLARVGRAHDRLLADLASAYARISDLTLAIPLTVVFVELTPVDETAIDEFTGELAGRGRSNGDVDAVNALLAEHSGTRGHELIQVCTALRDAGLASVLVDGLHPTAAGYDLMAAAAAAVLAPVVGASPPTLSA